MRTLPTIVVLVVAFSAAGWSQTPLATGDIPGLRFQERFRQADTDGDGRITEAEARAAGLWFTEDFNGVDTDRSGTVTLFEMGQAMQQGLSRWLSARDAADANHDGRLTADEAAQTPSLAEVFTTIDHDNDRSVSRAEFESYAIDRMYRGAELPSVAPNIIEKRF